MYRLSRTVPVNEPSKSTLSRHDVWAGLVMKANNALPYVPIMSKCEVIERGDGWLIRDILLKDVPLREKVTFEPEERVIFDRIGGDELGRIENIIGEDEKGSLTLTFSFGLTKEGIPDGSPAELEHFKPMEGAYFGAVASTLAAVRRTVDEEGRAKLPLTSEFDSDGDPSWIYDFFKSADSLDIARLSAHMTEDCRLTFANYPTVRGKKAFADTIGGAVYSRVKAMSHSLTGAWSVHNGRVGIAETIVMYTRLDGSLYVIKASTTFRRRDGKVYDLRIHADATQL
ncbi:MAG TPA: AtaL-like protein [Steroidobacteraceae bacterium]|nr:AtaL-like protein [Steroidobacteraceae bacterium]